MDQIREQLAYREDNKKEVEAFRVIQSLGGYTKVLIDQDAGKFMVTSASDLRSANPDVLSLDQVTSCALDVPETRTEEKQKNAEGKWSATIRPATNIPITSNSGSMWIIPILTI